MIDHIYGIPLVMLYMHLSFSLKMEVKCLICPLSGMIVLDDCTDGSLHDILFAPVHANSQNMPTSKEVYNLSDISIILAHFHSNWTPCFTNWITRKSNLALHITIWRLSKQWASYQDSYSVQSGREILILSERRLYLSCNALQKCFWRKVVHFPLFSLFRQIYVLLSKHTKEMTNC